METPYHMLQTNLQRKKLATNELMIEASKRKIAAALIQEPYVGGTKSMSGFKGARIFQNISPGEGTVKAAIAIFDPNLKVVQYPELTTNNIAVVRIQTNFWNVTLVSLYFEPDSPIEPYLNHLRRIHQEIGPKRMIIGGDSNAKSIWWGGTKEDKRGKLMMGALDELGLQILNSGTTPTFDTVRGDQHLTSYVDITACTVDILDRVNDWRVVEDLTGSDHNGIEFRVSLQKSLGCEIKRTTRIYNTKKANWAQFCGKLDKILTENIITIDNINKIDNTKQLDEVTQQYTDSIIKACSHTIPKKKDRETLTLPWWSDELAAMKAEVATRKRRIRCAAPIRKAVVVRSYLEKKEEYELAAAKAQVGSWKEFCEKQDAEGVWEGIYRVISRTRKREEDTPMVNQGKVLDAKQSAALLAQTFYPEDNKQEDNEEHEKLRRLAETTNLVEEPNQDPPFTRYELEQAIKSFNPKKAPGADGLTADICAQAIGNAPGVFLALTNKCLEVGYFPQIWKQATVVVLRKPNKDDYTAPKAYRPIGLLPVLGKVYEKMIVTRLKFHILPRMSRNQYGFMPQRSTEDSLYTLMKHIRSKLEEKKLVTIISLDIEGAFDSAWWPAIRLRLTEENCPWNLRRVLDSYLTERAVAVRYLGAECRKDTEKGCVQGSIGGPILWNLLLDPLLKGLERRGDYVQAFADDVVLVFDGKEARDIETRANASLAYVREWGVVNKLKFAPHKTCAMLITRKLKHDTPRLTMGGIDIGMSKEIKLLGLTIDHKLTFNRHVSNVCAKAAAVYKQLSRAARVSWGLQPEIIKTIYTAAVEPIVLYASSAWAPASNKIGVRKRLNSLQRSFAQKMCRAYRTASLNSTLVLAGVLPLDLRVREMASLYEAKRGATQPTLGDREVEKMASALEAPHPATRMSLKLGCLEDEEQYRAESHYEVRIFTDGSKIEGKVGAALTVWRGDAETKTLKLALPSYGTVYQAELLALCRAAKEINTWSERTFAIFSDSRAALQTVANPEALHPLAVEARQALREASFQSKEVSLFWIRAHAGLEGNERADCLAKEAALKLKKKPDYDLYPVSFVRRQIRMETLGEWDRRYREEETASTTKLFFPSAVEAYRTIKKIKITNELTQALTGHGGFSAYLARFKCKESPSCSCDPGEDESILHLLAGCPIFAKERYDLEQETDLKLTQENLQYLMTDKKYRETFISYIIRIVKIVNKRNRE